MSGNYSMGVVAYRSSLALCEAMQNNGIIIACNPTNAIIVGLILLFFISLIYHCLTFHKKVISAAKRKVKR